MAKKPPCTTWEPGVIAVNHQSTTTMHTLIQNVEWYFPSIGRRASLLSQLRSCLLTLEYVH